MASNSASITFAPLQKFVAVFYVYLWFLLWVKRSYLV